MCCCFDCGVASIANGKCRADVQLAVNALCRDGKVDRRLRLGDELQHCHGVQEKFEPLGEGSVIEAFNVLYRLGSILNCETGGAVSYSCRNCAISCAKDDFVDTLRKSVREQACNRGIFLT